MFDKGVTVLFVSHSIQQITRLCDRGILLEGGRLIANGPAKDVVSFYEAKLTEEEEEQQ